ncbi:hypothetical protein [Streptomyces sp. NPDC048659]|uniref:hypothetical protein n=1 Tax=Streptomyces sp. NPDC048659 TaxID=3155489 RepID=UPI003415CD3E
MAGTDPGGALSVLVTGVWMTILGVVVVTDLRGAARRLQAMSEASVVFVGAPFLRRPPGVRFVRVLAAVFVAVGVITLVEGVTRARSGGLFVDSPPMPAPLLAVLAVTTTLMTWMCWRREGLLRRLWAAGWTLCAGGGLYLLLAARADGA